MPVLASRRRQADGAAGRMIAAPDSSWLCLSSPGSAARSSPSQLPAARGARCGRSGSGAHLVGSRRSLCALRVSLLSGHHRGSTRMARTNACGSFAGSEG